MILILYSVCDMIQRDEEVLVFKVSELNTFPILSGDKNKGEYISSYQVEKYEGEACINKKSVPDKRNKVVRYCTVI